MAIDLAIFLATSGHSGVDRLAKNLVPALARRGYRIDLLKVNGHGPNLEEVPDNVRIIELGTSHVYTSLPALVRYLRREKPLSLFCDKDRVNHTALLAKKIAGVSTHLTLSMGTTVSIDLEARGAMHRWKTRWSMGKLYPFANNIIVTSEGVADDMSRYTGLGRARINVEPCPVVPGSAFEVEYEKPDHPWFNEGEPPLIIGLGELSFRKDFSTLIKAFALVRQSMKCRLMICGKGRQAEELQRLADESGVTEDFRLVGFVNEPLAYLAHSDLFAFTSRWEGLGFALIEALAVGLPAVSTDCPSGPREILGNGKYGQLVPVGDYEALAKAMIETLQNPPEKKFIQDAARPYEIENATTAYARAFNLPGIH